MKTALLQLIWQTIAFIVYRPFIADYMIKRAQRTPYFHLEGYMERWWLFNGYSSDQTLPPAERRKAKTLPWFPYSIRIHHILRRDLARAPHDHPWDARTIILKGVYIERRLIDGEMKVFVRAPGDTATLKYGEYHSITQVTEGGVWTLFICGDFKGDWGFLVRGKKVLHSIYNDGLEK